MPHLIDTGSPKIFGPDKNTRAKNKLLLETLNYNEKFQMQQRKCFLSKTWFFADTLLLHSYSTHNVIHCVWFEFFDAFKTTKQRDALTLGCLICNSMLTHCFIMVIDAVFATKFNSLYFPFLFL